MLASELIDILKTAIETNGDFEIESLREYRSLGTVVDERIGYIEYHDYSYKYDKPYGVININKDKKRLNGIEI